MTANVLPDDIALKVRAERKAMAAHLETRAAELRESANVGQWNNWAFDLGKAANALRSCGNHATGFMLFDHAPEKNRLTRARCRNRLCPFCHAISASRVADAIEHLLVSELEQGSELAALTLTIRHKAHEPLKLLRKTLDKAWANFTKRMLWKALVLDYHRKAELERTINGGWHPHFHVLVKLLSLKAPQAAWRAGTLQQHKLFRWWAKRRRKAGLAVDAAIFLTSSKSEIEDWLRSEWRDVTRKLRRESQNIRLEWVKPAGDGMVWGKGRDGKPVIKPIRKVAQELAKYDTKRSATGSKRGQLGIYQYSGSELAEYIRGMRNWHLHQSSKGWSKVTKAIEASDEAVDAEETSRDGGHYVAYVELVKDAQDAVTGVLPRQLVLAFELDALAILDVLDREHQQDPDFSPQQASALRSHLGRLYGDDQAELVPFKLRPHENRDLRKRRGLPVERCNGDYLEDFLVERAADEIARADAAEAAQAELHSLFSWSSDVNQTYREMQHA